MRLGTRLHYVAGQQRKVRRTAAPSDASHNHAAFLVRTDIPRQATLYEESCIAGNHLALWVNLCLFAKRFYTYHEGEVSLGSHFVPMSLRLNPHTHCRLNSLSWLRSYHRIFGLKNVLDRSSILRAMLRFREDAMTAAPPAPRLQSVEKQ